MRAAEPGNANTYVYAYGDRVCARTYACARASIRDIKDAIKALDTRMKEADMKYKFSVDFLASAFSVRWKPRERNYSSVIDYAALC